MAQEKFEKKVEWAFLATKLGQQMRVLEPPPEELPDSMKHLLEKLEKADLQQLG